MPSSTMVGSRPMMRSRRWYSSGARPCSATTCGVITGSLGSLTGGFFSGAFMSGDRGDEAFEQALAVGTAETRLDGVLGMRHHAEHRLGLVEDAGDAAQRAIGIARGEVAIGAAIAEGDLAAIL